jgi:hypothetical protein
MRFLKNLFFKAKHQFNKLTLKVPDMHGNISSFIVSTFAMEMSEKYNALWVWEQQEMPFNIFIDEHLTAQNF